MNFRYKTEIIPSIFSSRVGIFFSTTVLSIGIVGITLGYGVEKGEVLYMQKIQEQLTNQYLNSNEKAIGLRMLEEKILDAKIEGLTLEDTISDLDTDIATLQESITILFDQLAEPRKEIEALQAEKQNLADAMQSQLGVLLKVYTKLTFVSDIKEPNNMQAFFAMIDDSNVSLDSHLESLALREIEKKSLSSYLSLSEELGSILKEEKQLQQTVEEKEQKYKELTNRRDTLQQQKEMNEVLLEQSQQEKQEYDELLETSRTQMLQSQMDAMAVDNTLDELNEKIAELEAAALKKERGNALETAKRMVELKDEYSPEELTDEVIAAIDIQQLKAAKTIAQAPLAWPVDPSRGITAYFRDKEYYNMFKMHHNAIDIRAYQGTDVYAASDGYVYKAVNNGLGYSYIIILHRNNLRTVYGHISSIGVNAGEMVEEGQYIGKSGGMPGTKGAGKMTTGPHLHFEVLENEVYKDPLKYLEGGRL